MADIEEIKKRLDIVAVISDYLTLKKSGISYKAVCPFHSEKTPSFTVSPERQSWHCSGCGEGGDVISFVQKIDGLSFTEALERLAPRAGVEYKPASPSEIKVKSEKNKIIDVLEICARLYHEILLKHPVAEVARQYLIKRGIDMEMIAKFRLGYAPNAWETVSHALIKKVIEPRWGEIAGMTIKRTSKNSYYDRFRGRVVYPIDNQTGQVVGFTGRILTDATDQPKYVNTAESAVYNKSEALYGISMAKTGIRSNGFAVVVEGQMDVIAAHQFGFINTVATSGTALTSDHLKLIKRYTDKVIFSFDADDAGNKALKQAAYLSWDIGINPRVISIPFGKDPDECIRKDPKLWENAVKNAKPIVDHFIDFELNKYDQQKITTAQKKLISQEILPLIVAIPSAIEQAEYIRKLADVLNVPDSSVQQDLKIIKLSKHTRESNQSIVLSKPAEKEENFELDLEKKIIGLIIAYPEQTAELPSIRFENIVLGKIYQNIRLAKKNNRSIDTVISKLEPKIQKRLNMIVLAMMRNHAELEPEQIQQEIIDCINRVIDRERDGRVYSNAKAIADAYTRGDKAAAKELLKSLEHDMVIANRDRN